MTPSSTPLQDPRSRDVNALNLKISMPKSKTTVAAFLSAQIALSGKTQKEIATAVGYPNPNVITMFKKGHTKVPPTIVGRLALALGCDPAHLLRLVLSGYDPDLLETIESILAGQTVLTADEVAIVTLVREAAAGRLLDLEAPGAMRALKGIANDMAVTADRKAAAAVRSGVRSKVSTMRPC